MDGTRVEEFEPPVIIRVARNLEDMQRIAVVRALVYMAEQDCPYDEEFDGNDLAGATHLLGEAGGEPLGCLLEWACWLRRPSALGRPSSSMLARC